MAIPSKPTKLCLFRWNLSSLPGEIGQIPKPYALRAAEEKELNAALRVIRSSYELDPDWSGCGRYIEDVILPGVRKTFDEGTTCLFIRHGKRVIGASAYILAPEGDGVHLVSGPCVLSEYRNRGIGVALLGATLKALQAGGAREATGFTRPNTVSAKFLYSKFGGHPVTAPPAASEIATVA